MNRLLPYRDDYIYGLKKGFPIALGYIPVSFTFGLMAVGGGLPPLTAVLISLTNLTSAGQFAGTNLILEGAGYLEIILATIVINIRYMLMSLSLSQKINPGITSLQRLIFGFGITDETFSIASLENGKLSYSYMIGLITGPILGWTLGTALGAFISSALPPLIGNAMGIALYAMFIAIIVPPAKIHIGSFNSTDYRSNKCYFKIYSRFSLYQADSVLLSPPFWAPEPSSPMA